LLLADVDSTLVTQDKALTDRAIAAVKKLKESGVISRSPPAGRPEARRC
jgi:hydroxymethylpyrimidine pyrophosphatase-like HAD family hydrolase